MRSHIRRKGSSGRRAGIGPGAVTAPGTPNNSRSGRDHLHIQSQRARPSCVRLLHQRLRSLPRRLRRRLAQQLACASQRAGGHRGLCPAVRAGRPCHVHQRGDGGGRLHRQRSLLRDLGQRLHAAQPARVPPLRASCVPGRTRVPARGVGTALGRAQPPAPDCRSETMPHQPHPRRAPIRVAIVDDHPVLRNAIAQLAAESGDMQVVAQGEVRPGRRRDRAAAQAGRDGDGLGDARPGATRPASFCWRH